MAAVTTTRMSRHVAAPPAAVYRALLDPAAVARWKVPEGMSCEVHEFDAREGGTLRVWLTYDEPGPQGKTTAHTDTYLGRFVRLEPDELVVEVDVFETAHPALQGEMTSTIRLAAADDGGTEVTAVHEGVPDGVAPADNELGWRTALDRLAALVERDA
jgi:uncharacterized protein YndB with AHSA1/START domain